MPLAGQFDLAQVAGRIATLGFSFRDEAMPAMYVVASTEASRDRLQAQRRANPDDGFPRVLLIQVAPDEILVAPVADGALAELSTAFVRWLSETYPCRVSNEFGTDLTAQITAS